MEAVAKTGASAVARKLDAIRDRAGVQGREIALLLGTTPQTVSRWRLGRPSHSAAVSTGYRPLHGLPRSLPSSTAQTRPGYWLSSPIGYSKANAQPTASRRAASMMFWR